MFLDEGELGGMAGAFGPASLGSATISIPTFGGIFGLDYANP